MRGPRLGYFWPVGLALLGMLILVCWQTSYSPPCACREAEPTPAGLLPADILLQSVAAPMEGVLEGQKEVPCKAPSSHGLQETEALGGCWYPVQGHPPCGEGYEYKGSCFLPVPKSRKKEPTSGRNQ